MTPESARQARATALLAANSFVLVKVIETHWEFSTRAQDWAVIPEAVPVVVSCLMGMGCSYAMFGLVKGRVAVVAEVLAIVLFVAPIFSWMRTTAGAG